MLLSENRGALRQPLYPAFFTDRPGVEVATETTLVPRTDEWGKAAGTTRRKAALDICRER